MQDKSNVTIEVPAGWTKKKDLAYYRENAEWAEELGPYQDSLQAIMTEAAYLELALEAAIRYYLHEPKSTSVVFLISGAGPKIAVVKRLIAQTSSDQQSPVIEWLQICEEAVKLKNSTLQRLQADPFSVWLYELVELIGIVSDSTLFLVHALRQQHPNFQAVLRTADSSSN